MNHTKDISVSNVLLGEDQYQYGALVNDEERHLHYQETDSNGQERIIRISFASVKEMKAVGLLILQTARVYETLEADVNSVVNEEVIKNV